jgi:predicted metal-dependent phosphoesterase TrpH
LLCELHAHTREHSPCSRVGAADLVTAALAKGLDGLILTDHHYLWPLEEIQDLRSASAVPATFLLASGQEVTTSDVGDVLVYGPPVTIGPGIRLPELRRKFPDAALVLAHPWRGQNRPSMTELFDANLDAVEVLNRHHRFSQNRRAMREWFTWGFVATAGTDSHDRKVGVYPTSFPEEATTFEAVVASIKAGTCRPFLKSKRHRNFMH